MKENGAGVPVLFSDDRIHVVVGHYGSGKTEFALNLAKHLRRTHERVTLADLDIVNPFFRSAEQARWLEANDVRLIAPPYANTAVDVPVISAEVSRVFDDPGITAVLDVGGDPAGAAVLGRFQPQFARTGYRLYYIVNPYRPYSSTVPEIIELMRLIERTARLKPTYLVNNANLGDETTAEEIRYGQTLLREVARESGVPILCAMGRSELMRDLSDLDMPFFPIERLLMPQWLLS